MWLYAIPLIFVAILALFVYFGSKKSRPDAEPVASNQTKSPRKWLLALAVLFAVYFPVAGMLKASYVDLTPKGKIVFLIAKPYERFNHASIPFSIGLERFNQFGDDAFKSGDTTSPIMLYEDGKPLGPAHSTFADIQNLGAGRFSHLKDRQFVFSTSDNTDPNTNGRAYWLVFP